MRIAVVVQRYGLEINGGAELHAKLWAERLGQRHEVTVLTSRALDYTVWDGHYPAGESRVNGIRVIRFDHPQRGHSGRAKVWRRHLVRYRLGKLISGFGRNRVLSPIDSRERDGDLYFERQGPFCPDLVEHLKSASGLYDLVIFFTALYYPTAIGILACHLPSILVPTLHDERSMYWPLMHQVFRRPSWVLWNCEAERKLGCRLYGPDISPGSICGVGIDLAQVDPKTIAAVNTRYGISGPTIAFVGRISRSKGFHRVWRAFRWLRMLGGPRVQLVVVGQGFMPSLPQHPDIVYTGFVSDAERNALIASARASVVASKYESLSLVTLESMALGTPVIANGRSDVLRQHVLDSGSGFVFNGDFSLLRAMRNALALDPDNRRRLAAAGRRYVEERYAWPLVERKIFEAVEKVGSETGSRSARPG